MRIIMKIFYLIGTGRNAEALYFDILKKFSPKSVVFLSITEVHTHTLQNCPVHSFSIEFLERKLAKNQDIEIIVATPDLPQDMLRRLYTLSLFRPHWKINILPRTFTLQPRVCYAHLSKLELKDALLEDHTVPIEMKKLNHLKNKRVMITGAGGTLGRELAVQLLHTEISELYLLGHGEYSIFLVLKKLKVLQQQGVGTKIRCIPVLCELIDRDMVEETIAGIRPQIILHTAANKHVDLMEAYPFIGIASNVFATRFLIEAAARVNVECFAFTSTDKVIAPVSLYGACKLIAEELVRTFVNSIMKTFIIRSGNFLASRGSVLSVFEEQISSGGPVTVTAADCTRYFIRCSEIASAILHCPQICGEKKRSILCLHNNYKLSIHELIMKILELQRSKKDLPIQYTGLRPGEKKHEELFAPWEKAVQTGLPVTFTVERLDSSAPIQNLESLLESLYPICYRSLQSPDLYRDLDRTLELFFQHIPSFSYKRQT